MIGSPCLGNNAPEVQRYRAAAEAFEQALDAMEKGLREGFDDQMFQVIVDLHARSLDIQREYYDAASSRIGPPERTRKVGSP